MKHKTRFSEVVRLRCANPIAGGLLICLCAVAISIPMVFAGDSASSEPDPHTVALWLFDEPQYMNVTLTDAGANMYDLRLLQGGDLTQGRFGNALKSAALEGPAVALARERVRYDLGLTDSVQSRVIDARPVPTPDKLLQTLEGDTWTLEFWLKLDTTPSIDCTVFEIGRGTNPLLSCRLTQDAKRFIVSTSDATVLGCTIKSISLDDGEWHHVALTRQGAAESIQLWIDGRRQPAPSHLKSHKPQTNEDALPGLLGIIYGDEKKQWPVGVRVVGRPDFYEGIRTLYGPMAYVQNWRGKFRSPASGDVAFSISTDNAVSLTIDGKMIIETKKGDTPAVGHISLKKDQVYELLLEFLEDGGDSSVRLDWQLPGANWEPIPNGVLTHRRIDLEAAWGEIKVFAERLTGPDVTLDGWEPPNSDSSAKPDLALIGDALKNDPYLSLCGETLQAGTLDAVMDELRVSDVARYSEDFAMPASFSRNYGATPRSATEPTGPPLLFTDEDSKGPVALGSRKHIFIDDVMIEARRNLKLKPNPPAMDQPTDMRNDQPWEESRPGFFGDSCLLDNDGTIYFMYNYGAMWDAKVGTAVHCLATSKDGLHFEKPNVGLYEFNGSFENNIIIRQPVQGRIFKDTRPGIPEDERFKFSAYLMNRGIYLYTSPDCMRWRRNETIMLPFDCGGGVEMLWDDQLGRYNCYLRDEGWVFMRKPYGRAVALAETQQPFKP